MKIRDKIKVSIQGLLGHKIRNLLFLLFMVLILSCGQVCIQVVHNYNKYVSDFVKYNLAARKIFVMSGAEYVSPEEIIKEGMEYEHVIYAYSMNETYLFIDTTVMKDGEETELSIELKPLIEGYELPMVQGKLPESSNEIVCPVYMANGTTKADLIDMTQYLNETISTTYEQILREDINTLKVYKTYNIDLTISGLFNNFVALDAYMECYIDESLLREMVKNSKTIYSEKFLEQANVNEELSTILIVDDPENASEIKQALQQKGYYAELGYEFDFSFIHSIQNICYLILVFVFCMLFVITVIYISNAIKKEKVNLGILKACGYTNQEISSIILIRLLIMIFLSFMISLLLTVIGDNIATLIITNQLNYNYIQIKMSILFETIYILYIIAIVMIVSIIVSRKICKLEVRDILNENI